MSMDSTHMPLCLELVCLWEGELVHAVIFVQNVILWSNCTYLYYLSLSNCYCPLIVYFPSLTLYSMLLLNYLARKRTESGMVAGFTISVPWNALKSAASMEEPLNWLLFNKYLTNGLCQAVTRSDTVQFHPFLGVV